MNKLPGPEDVNWEAARQCLGADGLLSIVLPCHNLGKVIADNIRQITATFRGCITFEIIAVDDGSKDNTLDQLRALEPEYPELRIVALSPNQGKGHALRTGFGDTRGSHILFLDADLDLPPHQSAWFFERMLETGSDIVIGAKRHPRSELVYPRKRRIISAIYYLTVRLLFGLPVRDTQTGIKLFRRAVLEAVLPRMLVKRFAYDLELLVIARHLGYKIAEAPITLDFHGPYGCLKYRVVRRTTLDTLAIFYRLHILRYYQAKPEEENDQEIRNSGNG